MTSTLKYGLTKKKHNNSTSNDKKKHTFIDYGLEYLGIQQGLRDSVLNKGPGVKSTSCLYLVDVPTPVGSVYADQYFRKHVRDLTLPGDGTVSSLSITGPCTQWKSNGENVSIEPISSGQEGDTQSGAKFGRNN